MKFTQKYDKQRLGKLFDQSSNLSLSAVVSEEEGGGGGGQNE